MRNPVVRLLMVLVGVAVLTVYTGLGLLAYLGVLAVLANPPDPLVAVGFVAVVTLLSGYLSYRLGTARLLAGLDAAELPRTRAPHLHARVDSLQSRMAVAPPRVLVADMPAPNALAVGRPGRGALVFDRSLLGILSADEFEAIAAHELAHLESHDGLVQTLAYAAVRTLVGLGLLLLLPLLLVLSGVARAAAWVRGRPREWAGGPFLWLHRGLGSVLVLVLFAFTLLVRAHSRRREFAADDRAVEVTGKPAALARALRKIERASQPGFGLLSTLYVRGDEENPLARLLSTHPSTDERVERLTDRRPHGVDGQDEGRGGRRIRVE